MKRAFSMIAIGVASTLCVATTASARQVCGEWTPGMFPYSGLVGGAASIVGFDDGSGPAVYFGGQLRGAGAVRADNVARWNGSAWSPVGLGFDDQVRALVLFDDGNGPVLYASGDFTHSGGISANHVAKWNGHSWSPVGSGLNGRVWSLGVFDDGSGPVLYAGGGFTSIGGGGAANRIARWDGNAWSAVGGGVDDLVRAFASFDDGHGVALFAAGDFTMADGQPANHVARWDGAMWTALGAGLDRTAYAMLAFDAGDGTALYLGGDFRSVDGSPIRGFARWNGTAWSRPALVNNANFVSAFALFDDGGGPALFAGGRFDFDGTGDMDAIAKWQGDRWVRSTGPRGPYTFYVNAIAAADDGRGVTLFAGSAIEEFQNVGRFDGHEWLPLGGMDDPVRSLLVEHAAGGDRLVAVGGFVYAGGQRADHIASFDGTTWSALGSGIERGSLSSFVQLDVQAIAEFDDGSGSALYVGGRFGAAGGAPAMNIARWNGTAWSAVGDGIDGEVRALEVFDDGTGPALYAGGAFTTAGGGAVHHIAKWNGTQWSDVGGGMSGGRSERDGVNALAVFDDGSGPALFAAGYFWNAGSALVYNVARWNGTAWAALGIGIQVNGEAFALQPFDDGSGPVLFVSGPFAIAGGHLAGNISRWNGSEWSAPQGGFSGNGFGAGWTLTPFDDGSGPALVATGNFTRAGAAPALGIARWTSNGWSAFGTRSVWGANAATVFDDGTGPAYWIGSSFVELSQDSPDRLISAFLARWKPSPLSGNVIGATGPASDVLRVNDSAGGVARSVTLGIGEPIRVSLDRAPSGPEPANYVLLAWSGLPRLSSAATSGGQFVGCTANPTALNPGARPQPTLCGLGGLGPEWCGAGRTIRLPRSAPWAATHEHGLAHRATFTVQAVLADDAALNSAALSVSNAIVVRVR